MRVRGWYLPGCSASSLSVRGVPSASRGAPSPSSRTRGPSRASRPMPSPFGFFVAMNDCDRSIGWIDAPADAIEAVPYAGGLTGAEMKYRVFVDGQEGTTGLRIHEYLALRDDVEVLRIE